MLAGGGGAEGPVVEVPRCRLRSVARSLWVLEICCARVAVFVGVTEAEATETLDKALEYPRDMLVAR